MRQGEGERRRDGETEAGRRRPREGEAGSGESGRRRREEHGKPSERPRVPRIAERSEWVRARIEKSNNDSRTLVGLVGMQNESY